MSTPDPIRPGHTDEQIIALARKAGRANFYRYAAILSIFATGVVGILAVQASKDARHATEQVARLASQNRINAIAACERSKVGPEGFRFVLAEPVLLRQVRQTHDLGIPNLAERFGIPAHTLKQSQAQQRKVAAGLLATDCVAANPKP